MPQAETTLQNSDITERMNQMLPKLITLFDRRGCVASSRDAQTPDALFQTILELLSCSSNAPLSLEQLNENYNQLMGGAGASYQKYSLINPPLSATEQDKQNLLEATVVYLDAIVDGFKLDIRQRAYAEPSASTQPRVVHHYHGCRDNFWRDMMLYNLLMNNNRASSGGSVNSAPSTSQSNKKDDKNQVTWAGLVLAFCLVAGAAATAGYDVVQTYYRAEEIWYGEDVLGNTAKLSVTAFAGFSGYLLGAMIGASCFANPILGGVCVAFIAAAAGMAASKWLVGRIHAMDKNGSESMTDPRFCLSQKEEDNLVDMNINPDVVREILRECAIAIKNEPSNGLVFWQNPHRELISLVRNVKKGDVNQIINMDVIRQPEGKKQRIAITKQFDLKRPYTPPENIGSGLDNASDNTDSMDKTTQSQAPISAPYVGYEMHGTFSSVSHVPSAPPLDRSEIPVAQAWVVGN